MERKNTKTQMKGLKVADVIQLVLTTASTDPILRKSIKPTLPFYYVYCFATLSHIHVHFSEECTMK